jgi:hypothetical protein
VPEATRGGHSMGHTPIAGSVDQKKFADKWLMGQFASLLDRLRRCPRGRARCWTAPQSSVALSRRTRRQRSCRGVARIGLTRGAGDHISVSTPGLRERERREPTDAFRH